MAEPMDPREILARIATEDLIPPEVVVLSRVQLASLLGVAFLKGAVCMQEQPAWAGVLVAAVADDERDRFGSCGDAAMARALVARYPIAVSAS